MATIIYHPLHAGGPFSSIVSVNSIMNAVEDYSRKWAKKEAVDDSALSEWVKAIRHLVKRRLYFFFT